MQYRLFLKQLHINTEKNTSVNGVEFINYETS